MKCHKHLNTNIECLKKKCSLWNMERMECAEKTFLKSYGAIEHMSVKLMNILERIEKEEKT